MIVATVPAEITTVEDKIVGNLGPKQVILIVVPLFLSAALYSLLPPFNGSAPYKTVLMVCISALCLSLAIRIKKRIVLDWIAIFIRYASRPRYYVFNKNDDYLRDIPVHIEQGQQERAAKLTKPVRTKHPSLAVADLVRVERLLTDPDAKLRFKTTKKGDLRVYITEVE